VEAERGSKSFLEQNEELSAEYYKIVRKLETVTQDNFELRRQLEAAEETSMALITELQAEISQLKEKIIEKNQRGSSEQFLREENLRREKVSVEEQIQDCKTIKSEMNILAEKKEELEKEMTLLRLEKDSISLSLDGALCKISQLERRQEDQETVMRTSEREVEELKTSNNYLLEKLELWSMSHSSSPTMKNSLMSELELSTSESETSLQRSKHFDIIDEEEEDIEEFEFLQEISDTSNKDYDTDTINFHQEMQSIEIIIKKLNENMRRRSGLTTPTTSNSSITESSLSVVKISKLRYVVEELEILINDNFLHKTNDLLSRGNQTEEIIEENHEEKREELRTELEKSNLKLAEMETENAKNKVVVGGLCEKLLILETRLKDVNLQREELIQTLKNNGEKRQCYVIRESLPDKSEEKAVVVVTEQNNNNICQLSFFKQFEKLEGMIRHILETKDPPKRRLTRR